MEKHNISILCMQETHVSESQHFVQDGYLVILSGALAATPGYLYSGVGFMIAPSAVHSVISFKLLGDRLATIRIKVSGGILNIMSAYAPHAGKAYEERKSLFDSVAKAWTPYGNHNCTIALGDFNTRLGERLPGEDDVVGPYVVSVNPNSNRELLIETCWETRSIIANT